MRSSTGTRGRRGTAVLLVGALALAGCASAGPEPRQQRAEVEFLGVAAEAADFDGAALSRLAADLLAQSPDKNSVLSPLSIMLALAMLREGASGESAAQLDAVLGLDPENPGEAVADLRARLGELDGEVGTIDRKEPPESPLLHLADALFVAPDLELGPGFLERVARFHDAGVDEADFRGGKAKALLDAWVRRETGGLVEEAPSEPAPETKLVLMNAVLLAARWAEPFDPANTFPSDFTRADGSTVKPETMVDLSTRRFVEGPGWRAVELPYVGGGLAMILALPDEGAGPLTAQQWDEVRAGISSQSSTSKVVLWLPRWELSTALDLKKALPPLGIERVFAYTGELDGVFPEAFVSGASHVASITVAEKGTVAAAVTQVEAEAGSAPEIDVELRLDRPFDFQIVVGQGMVPVFAGHVADPTAG